jgi:chromate transport protein ChrA
MQALAAERQLGRVEGWRIVCHPVLWLAIGTLVMYTVMVGSATEEHFLLTGYGLVLPAFVAMVLMAMAVRRSRTQGADELFDVLPIDQARRSVGHGLAASVVGLLAVVLTAAVWAGRWPSRYLGLTEETRPDLLAIPRPDLAQALQGPMAVVVFCALGVALGRWIPSWLIAVVLVVPMAMQFLAFGSWLGEDLRPNTVISSWRASTRSRRGGTSRTWLRSPCSSSWSPSSAIAATVRPGWPLGCQV